MKLLTLVVPSYQAEGTLRRCVERMVPAGPELDVLIVDDGSTDGTPALADALASEYPEIVRVIHQENGGHGEGLNQGIRTARGVYLKSVDADDRIDTASLTALLDLLRDHADPDTWADLVINDYAFDLPGREAKLTIRFNHIFRPGIINTWVSCRRFPIWRQFMIHSVCYRVELLREHRYELPKHTFFEDNLYIYQPLPWTEKILYLPYPLYGYATGQESQSVNPNKILRLMGQNTQMVTRAACTWTWAQLREFPRNQRDYMVSFLACQLLIVTMLHMRAGNEEARRLNRQMWEEIRSFDPELYRRVRRQPACVIITRTGPLARRLIYHIIRTVQRRMGF